MVLTAAAAVLEDIKAFLSDVKPALLSALDAEYEKNPYEVWCLTIIFPLINYLVCPSLQISPLAGNRSSKEGC